MRRIGTRLVVVLLATAGAVALPLEPAAASYTTLFHGHAVIVSNPQSRMVFDVENGSAASQAEVQTYRYHGKANQLWRFSQFGVVDGTVYWSIKGEHSGRCVDVQWGSTSPGAPAWLWDCHNGPAQLFAVDFSANDQFGVPAFRLRNLNSQLCLTVTNPVDPLGWPLRQEACNAANRSQDFQFTHPIASIDSGFVVTGNNVTTAALRTQPFAAAPGQDFRFTAVPGTNQLKIIHVSSNGCLRPVGGTPGQIGAPVAPVACTTNMFERWGVRLQRTDSFNEPTYQIVNVASGHCLDLDWNQPLENAPMRTWTCGTSFTQIWYLYA